MKILFLDVADSGIVIRYGDRKKKVADRDALLAGIDALIKEDGGKPQGLAIRTGVGRFSETRSLVSIANALSYAWDIPVASVGPGEDPSIPVSSQRKMYARASYSSEPSITPPKPSAQ